MPVQYPHHSAELLLEPPPPDQQFNHYAGVFGGDGSIPSPPFSLSSFGSAENEKPSIQPPTPLVASQRRKSNVFNFFIFLFSD